jgi:hypothetical protein
MTSNCWSDYSAVLFGRTFSWLTVLALLAWASCVSAATPWQAALRDQSDPAKLATLGKRAANPRVNRIVFYLHQANESGTNPSEALDWAFGENGTTGLVAVLTKATQLLNYQHAIDWGLLTDDNLERLKRGNAPIITKGRHQGQATDVDHIVPISLAPEAGNSLANLELLPSSVNRSKGARVGIHELGFAKRLHEAGIIKSDTLSTVRWVFVRTKVMPWIALAMILVLVWFHRRNRKPMSQLLMGGLLTGLFRGLFRGR